MRNEMEKLIRELPGDSEIVALFKRISNECMIARPGPAIAPAAGLRFTSRGRGHRAPDLHDIHSVAILAFSCSRLHVPPIVAVT
jgi:hypothetical protein